MSRSKELMVEDLRKSGLAIDDLNARPIEAPERAACNIPMTTDGYAIPYLHMDGRPTSFYRCRLFDHEPKYKQPKETSAYVYFPKGFLALAKRTPYVVITEGEKKATITTKQGIPCIGLGGIDSWRSRTLLIPDETELTKKNKDTISVKLPSGKQPTDDQSGGYALGMQELIDFIIANDKVAVIIYDSDSGTTKTAVQRAAATLAFELRYKGAAFNKIRQVVLPQIPETTKVGLDDYLQYNTADELRKLITTAIKDRGAFPQHPSVRDFINKKLQKARLNRKEVQSISIAALSTMDAEGQRLRSEQESQTYYFDGANHKLLKADFTRVHDLHDTPFGQYLYRRFGLSKADRYVNEWLAAQFTGEDPIGNVSPHRVIARTSIRDDSVTYQLSDSKYIRVTATGLTVHNNGDNGVLFEAGQVEALDTDKLLQEFERQKSNATNGHIKPLWMDVLSHVRLRDHGDQQRITALLYYMSPWLYRWRGLQLPIEQIIGESGSGKSTLMELRLAIINGQPRLRNAPTDLKDWHASISNSGGLHVTDNVQLVDRSLRQRLSDEICRIITEPDPHIEMRKLYTNADLVRMPIRSVFAITAIQQPFQNADLIQRSVITELDKMGSLNYQEGQPIVIRYDSEWRNNHLAQYNGREGWIAHHLLVLQRFFALVATKWNDRYQAKHRLINFEQTMSLIAEAVGIESDWIPEYLTKTVDKALAESDWTFEGLRQFVDNARRFPQMYTDITPMTIADWATRHEDFAKCEMLIQSRRLMRYMGQHKTMIASVCGLVEIGIHNGRPLYKVVKNQNETRK